MPGSKKRDTRLKCWICGNDATSGEHKTKRTDLRLNFSEPTQDRPLFYHDAKRQNQLVRSFDSKILKSPSRLCAHCNNARTQPHDRAWEKMSTFLRQCHPPMRPGVIIRANRIFPYDTKRQMLHVHLYFLKLFGCMVVEGQVPLDITIFANSIMNEKAHPCVYLEFGPSMSYDGKGVVGRSDLEALKNDYNECVFAVWLYQLAHLTVNVMFAASNVGWDKGRLSRTWHPKFGTKRLTVAESDPHKFDSEGSANEINK